jgi:hypothetical protein
VIGSAFNLEPIDVNRRLCPSRMPGLWRDRAMRWAHRMQASESLKAAWDKWTARIVFYRMKGGDPQVYCEADLTQPSSFKDAIRDVRLGKERMIVKRTWHRWQQNLRLSNRVASLERRDANEYNELLSIAKWRQAVRDGGRKRMRSHLVPINPLAVDRRLRAGS